MAIEVFFYEDEESGKEYVSHGVDTDTLENVVLPPEEKKLFIQQNCRFNAEIGGFVLK